MCLVKRCVRTNVYLTCSNKRGKHREGVKERERERDVGDASMLVLFARVLAQVQTGAIYDATNRATLLIGDRLNFSSIHPCARAKKTVLITCDLSCK